MKKVYEKVSRILFQKQFVIDILNYWSNLTKTIVRKGLLKVPHTASNSYIRWLNLSDNSEFFEEGML